METRKHQAKHRDRWIAAALLVSCLLLYHLAPVRQLYDWRYITAVSHSLLHDGDFELDRQMGERSRYQIHQVDGRYYHLFPNAPAVLNLPFVWVYERLGWPVFDNEGTFQGGSEVRILRTVAAATTAAAVAVLFLLARLFLPTGWALALTLLFAFGSPLLSTASRPFWSHSWGVLLLSLGLYWALAPARRHELLLRAAAASAIAWSVFTRPPFALSALALTVVLAAPSRRRQSWLVFVGVGAAWLALFCGYSLAVYGEWVPPYFYSNTTSSGRLTAARLLTLQGEAMLGTLVSPIRGLFFFTPFLLVPLYLVLRHWRVLADRLLAGAGLAVIACHWYLISSFRSWGGGASFGPRLFTDLMPWFLVLGALGLAALGERDRARPAAGRHAARWALFGVLAAASLFIHLRGATERATMRHFGTWNFRHPTFLNGLVPVPGMVLPGALLRYDASVDRDPADGWQNLTRRRDWDLDLHASVRHVKVGEGYRVIRGAFVFTGAGGGTARSLQELGGVPNVSEGPATFEVWFRPATAAGGGVLLESGGGDTGFTLFLRQGRPGLEVRSGGRARRALLESPVAVDGAEFSQLVAVIEARPAGRELSLYLDGRLAAGPLLAPEIDDWAGGDATGVGTDDANAGLPAGDFVGQIAILQVYPEALTAGQVEHNHGAVVAPPDTPRHRQLYSR